jgi:hypothetical protein
MAPTFRANILQWFFSSPILVMIKPRVSASEYAYPEHVAKR